MDPPSTQLCGNVTEFQVRAEDIIRLYCINATPTDDFEAEDLAREFMLKYNISDLLISKIFFADIGNKNISEDAIYPFIRVLANIIIDDDVQFDENHYSLLMKHINTYPDKSFFEKRMTELFREMIALGCEEDPIFVISNNCIVRDTKTIDSQLYFLSNNCIVRDTKTMLVKSELEKMYSNFLEYPYTGVIIWLDTEVVEEKIKLTITFSLDNAAEDTDSDEASPEAYKRTWSAERHQLQLSILPTIDNNGNVSLDCTTFIANHIAKINLGLIDFFPLNEKWSGYTYENY